MRAHSYLICLEKLDDQMEAKNCLSFITFLENTKMLFYE